MATQAAKAAKATAAQARKAIKIADEVFLYFEVECEWATPILGVAPMGSTLKGHTIHLWEERLAVVQRAFKRRPASERIPAQAPLSNVEDESVAGITEVEIIEPEALHAVQAEYERLLKIIKEDSHMDRYTKKMFEELELETDPLERLIQRILRSINTFHRNPDNGNFVCRNLWFKGDMKSGLRDFFGMRDDQANRVARNVTIYPSFVDLGVNEPDEVADVNVPLQGGRGDAQATIKRFHMADPRKHGCKQFSLTFQILNASLTGDIVEHFGKLLEAMGGIGVGGSRPEFGVFEPLTFKQLSYVEGKQIIREMRNLPIAVLPMAA